MLTAAEINEILKSELVKTLGAEAAKIDHSGMDTLLEMVREKYDRDAIEINKNHGVYGTCKSGVQNCEDSKLNFENWMKEALKEAKEKYPGKLPGDIGY